MITNPMQPTAGAGNGFGLRYALMGVQGYGIALATMARMLDDGTGRVARIMGPEEPVPWGAEPVLLADTTLYAAVQVEHLVQAWNPQIPRPWLVLAADVPAPAAPAARYRIRALRSRLAGVIEVPYLPSLRAVEGPEEAMKQNDVRKAADNVRRQFADKTRRG